MATGELYEELTEIVTCKICYEVMEERKPRQLPCMHVFCEGCLQHMLDDTKAEDRLSSCIQCPTCKKTIYIPGGSLAKLPVFFQASEVHNVRKVLKDRYKFCKKCKLGTHKVHVTSYCFVCRSGHCDNCRVKHDKIFQNHAHISVTPSTVNCIMCPDHDAHFTYFCMTCAKSICTDCYVGEHDKHKIYDLVYDGKEVQENVKEFLLSGLRSADKTMSNLDDLESKLSQDIKTAIAEMRSHRDYLLKLVNDQYEFMSLELSQKEADIKIDLVKSKQLVEEARSCIDRLLKQAESWQEPVKGIPEARIKKIEELVADIKQTMPTLYLDVVPQSLEFVCGDDDITLGEIFEEYTMPVSVKPTLLYKIETGYGVMDIDYLDNGQLIVCMPYDIKVYDDSGRKIPHDISAMCKPRADCRLYSLSVDHNRRKVVVLEYRGPDTSGCLHVYIANGKRWQYNRYVVCEEPWCVAVTCGGDYVVYSNGEKKLYRYSPEGIQMLCIDTGTSSEVHDLFVDENEKLFVCFNEEVVVYNKRGEHVFTLPTTDRELEPWGLCIDKDRQIFVCDNSSRSILVFNNNFVRCLTELDFGPWNISLYGTMKLAVSGDMDKIYVYKL